MKVTRKIVSRGILASVVVLMVLQLKDVRSFARERAGTLPRSPLVQPVAPLPTPNCTGTGAAFARCEFEELTNATKLWPAASQDRLLSDDITGNGIPVWTRWQDKCDLGLQPLTTCGAARKNHEIERLSSDLLSVSIPTQVLQLKQPELAHSTESPKSTKATTQQLASVLFSPQLAEEVRRLSSQVNLDNELNLINVAGKSGPDRQIDLDHLNPNSTAIKLIWEVVLQDGDDPYYQYGVHVYEKAPDEPAKLLDPSLWGTDYRIDPKETKPCPDILPAPLRGSAAPHVPINCFYHFIVDTNDPIVMNQLGNLGAGIITAVASSKHAYLVLVGAHIITFNKVTQPLWQWMTFYWTRNSNHATTGWANPWQHYQMKTTSAPAEGKPISPDKTVANPYLEGNIDKLGMKTNCLSCHSLAVYSGAGSKEQQALSIMDKIPHYPDSETSAISQSYFDQAIRTHFLWSIVTNPQLTYPYPPAPSAASTRKRPAKIKKQPTQ